MKIDRNKLKKSTTEVVCRNGRDCKFENFIYTNTVVFKDIFVILKICDKALFTYICKQGSDFARVLFSQNSAPS